MVQLDYKTKITMVSVSKKVFEIYSQNDTLGQDDLQLLAYDILQKQYSVSSKNSLFFSDAIARVVRNYPSRILEDENFLIEKIIDSL